MSKETSDLLDPVSQISAGAKETCNDSEDNVFAPERNWCSTNISPGRRRYKTTGGRAELVT